MKEWIRIPRDKDGFYNGIVTDLDCYLPFIIRDYTDAYGEFYFLVNEDNFSEWAGDIDTKPQYSHLLPNVPLIKE